ncbi:DNA-binding winged helix-turn-helix (wHTH) protein [Pseudomonas nitritireducens]|uniref:DNA-binding winged helix-turn-helix (WHTH) protein n=1 Tax=Pseudomonas nitroreducens TaxID=46680 RepID=A0A7W7KFW2_PSENT|nr:winged helix-turn-helix domain-containing protein [Pseudomonas nitritireducens]MBB4862052.1 DNA-binding winged helix-turn-helix (wHTH) protein [Pseudomonas nitritireducens]
MSTFTSTPADSRPAVACLTLRTGRSDCTAQFYPALYQLDLDRDGQVERIDLGFSGSRVLERLLQSPGDVVARDELLTHAWSDRVVGQGSLNQQIYTLRQVLADEKQRQIIQTLPRRGYMFNPQYLVTAAPQNDAEEADAEPEVIPLPVPRQSPTAPNPRRLKIVAGSLCLFGLLVLCAAFYYTQLRSPVLTAQEQVGALQITYVEEDQQELQRLIRTTRPLAHQLAALGSRPISLLLHMTSGFYELVCVQPEGNSNWLLIHESQVARIPQEQLRKCLN